MTIHNECPRCRAERLRGWTELNEEAREVVERLPASAEVSIEERMARHRWCEKCWYEDTGREMRET